MEKRLSEENISRRGHIKVVTYDDLLSVAKAVYQNTLYRPLVLRVKEQKSFRTAWAIVSVQTVQRADAIFHICSRVVQNPVQNPLQTV
jgi:hypothetical protein